MVNTEHEVERCYRCAKPVPALDDPEYCDWEADVDGDPICPDCVMPAEQQATDEADMDMKGRS
jgi:hypothetical protein